MTDNIVDITERLKDKDLGFKYCEIGGGKICIGTSCGSLFLEPQAGGSVSIDMVSASEGFDRKELAQFLHAAVIFLDSEGRYGIEQGLTVPALNYSDAENEKLKRFMGQFEARWSKVETGKLKIKVGMEEAIRSGLVERNYWEHEFLQLTNAGMVYHNENFGGDL